MNIACVDDNRIVLRQLESLLEQYSKDKNIFIDCACYGDAKAFLRDAQTRQFDIVFMDIYFDGQDMNGLEAARKLRQKEPQCIIIFLTSSADHMPEAFAVHAFSYVMKDNLNSQIENVLNDAVRVMPEVKTLAVKTGTQELAVPHNKIVCIYTERHYLIIRVLDSEPLRMRMTFRELLDQLEQEDRFLQINKGVLVNMDHIQTIEEGDCAMIDGTWLPVRHRDRSSIVATWRAYQFQRIREEQS